MLVKTSERACCVQFHYCYASQISMHALVHVALQTASALKVAILPVVDHLIRFVQESATLPSTRVNHNNAYSIGEWRAQYRSGGIYRSHKNVRDEDWCDSCDSHSSIGFLYVWAQCLDFPAGPQCCGLGQRHPVTTEGLAQPQSTRFKPLSLIKLYCSYSRTAAPPGLYKHAYTPLS